MGEVVAAIDQGTTSTRFMLIDHAGHVVASHQLEHSQVMPRPGWVEHNPIEVWERTSSVIRTTLAAGAVRVEDIVAVGIANQRETTVMWDRRTGRPLANAVVWQDTRSDRIVQALESDGHGALIRSRTGLPPATYFSAGKVQWLMENVSGARRAVDEGTAAIGTIDSWLLWHLTGGVDGGQHLTDVTNASRTMLMDLDTLDWDEELLDIFGIPRHALPQIVSSSHASAFGTTRVEGPFGAAIPITAALGDQQAAMVGQVCLEPGEAKNTYGTGNFLLMNTGTRRVTSSNGLLTTVCHRLGDGPAHYALEGSIAVTGSAIQWLRDQLGIISGAAESESLARQVDDNGGVWFVPAFSGLFAPYWRSDARGVIVGLSRYNTNAHIARAALEAICYQSSEVVQAMERDSGVALSVLKVDGGVTANDLCMQIQADVSGVPVVRPVVAETTALGAAYAAGLAVGFWSDAADLRANWVEDRRWLPRWDQQQRDAGHHQWRRAVDRSIGWLE